MHHESIEQIKKKTHTDLVQGLNNEQVSKNLETFGENRFLEEKRISLAKMIFKELTRFLNLLLIAASIISIVASGHLTDGLFIMAIVILNVFLSVYQERKASNAVMALKKISAPTAKVIRNGEIKSIDSSQVVVGDIVIIEAGDYIPADLRLFESVNLKVDESILTGESVPVEKDSSVTLNEQTAIGDRVNSCFMSTIVTYGRGKGIITKTGMQTEMGKIAGMLSAIEDEMTPLQIRIDKLGKLLGLFSLIVVGIIFIVGLFYDYDLLDLFLVSVSLAVAAIPEGLPAVITVVLAVGMKKMAKQNAIVKHLSAVETLGSTTVICTDKTGTLTENKMVVTHLFDNNHFVSVSGVGYTFDGKIDKSNPVVDKITTISVLCNDATILNDDLIGDPTELALIALAAKNQKLKKPMNEKTPRIDEVPFDSDRKMMSTLHQVGNQKILYVKGAMDSILTHASFYLDHEGNKVKLTEKHIKTIQTANEGLAKKAMRVLAFAYKEVTTYDKLIDEENDLIFAGLVGMIDPPREEVKAAIRVCKKAHIRTVMITGDHKLTATAIGKELGIIEHDNQALSGKEIDALSDEAFLEKIKTINVFARVSPSHKVRIVKALQDSGEIASMTGDGVNDAPALKQADIGVAMGITGTDVSKEASDMILMDDNFTTIVHAVEEGRIIYGNIRKFVGYLISCNVGEILAIFIAMLIGLGSPLLAIQILWINLVTDAFPAFALGLEPKEDDVMDDHPIDKDAAIIDKRMGIAIANQAIFLSVAVLISYVIGNAMNSAEYSGTTFAFITIITGELLRALSSKNETKHIWQINPFSNKTLNMSLIVGFALLFIVIYVPGINAIFRTDINIQPIEFIVALSLGLIPFIGGEFGKIVKKRA
jgi:Ca2+-transporting ATPase